jgi:hypothetical protein
MRSAFVFKRVSSANIVPSLFHRHPHMYNALTRTNGRSVGTFEKKQCSFGKRRELEREVLTVCSSLKYYSTLTRYLTNLKSEVHTAHLSISSWKVYISLYHRDKALPNINKESSTKADSRSTDQENPTLYEAKRFIPFTTNLHLSQKDSLQFSHFNPLTSTSIPSSHHTEIISKKLFWSIRSLLYS